MSPSYHRAGILLIGDELLLGQICDANLPMLAQNLSSKGAFIQEVRIIPDDKNIIVPAIQEFHQKYDFVITTGGIGPTHDDITMECLADAFNVPLICHMETFETLKKRYIKRNQPFNLSRQKMTYLPQGAHPIPNPVSIAPGAHLHNIFTLAGVPDIAQGMMPYVLSQIPQGALQHKKHIFCSLLESDIAEEVITTLQQHQDNLTIGIYPHSGETFPTEIVLKSFSLPLLEQVFDKLVSFITQQKGIIKIS